MRHLWLVVGVWLVLASGCAWNGTQQLTSSQQYEIASASVRAVVNSVNDAYEAGAVSPQAFLAMDLAVQSARKSLADMYEAVLKDDTITSQWYLAQTQQMVRSITTMLLRAKELNSGDNRGVGSNSGTGGTQPSAAGGGGPTSAPATGALDPGAAGGDQLPERNDVRQAQLERARREAEAGDLRAQVVLGDVVGVPTEKEFD